MKTMTKISFACAFAGVAGMIAGVGYHVFEKQQREKEIEALLASGSICIARHNDDRILTSTVDIGRALAVVRLGEIGFGPTVATVTLTDKDNVTRMILPLISRGGGRSATRKARFARPWRFSPKTIKPGSKLQYANGQTGATAGFFTRKSAHQNPDISFSGLKI